MMSCRQKKTIRTFALVLVFVLCISFVPYQVCSGNNTALVVKGAESLPGSTLRVPVNLTSEGTIRNMQFDLGFDRKLLTYTGVEKGALAPEFTVQGTDPASVDGKIRIMVYNFKGEYIPSGTGSVALLSFQVAEDAKAGSGCTLALSNVKLSGSDGEITPVSLDSGLFKVKGTPANGGGSAPSPSPPTSSPGGAAPGVPAETSPEEEEEGEPAADELPVPTVIMLTIGSKIVSVNGIEEELDVAPFINPDAGRTLVPVRFISESLGFYVQWIPEKREVGIKDGDNFIVLTVGEKEVQVNGKTAEIDCPPEIIDNRTFLPLRFVSEQLGALVHWDGETKTITIKKNE